MQDDHSVTLCKLFNVYSMWNSKTGWLLRLKIPFRQFMLKHSSNFNILYIFRYITPHPPYIISHSYITFSLGQKPLCPQIERFFVLCQDSVQHSGGIHHTVSSHLWEKKQGTLPLRCFINCICFLQCFGSGFLMNPNPDPGCSWSQARIRIQAKVFLWQRIFWGS